MWLPKPLRDCLSVEAMLAGIMFSGAVGPGLFEIISGLWTLSWPGDKVLLPMFEPVSHACVLDVREGLAVLPLEERFGP
jgi:hypothetical protein